MTLWKYITNSTMKREYALFLTLWLLAVASYLVYIGATDMQFRILELFAYPILVGAFGVFGLDWISKQTTIAGPQSPPADTTVTTTSADVPATLTITSTKTADDDEARG